MIDDKILIRVLTMEDLQYILPWILIYASYPLFGLFANLGMRKKSFFSWIKKAHYALMLCALAFLLLNSVGVYPYPFDIQMVLNWTVLGSIVLTIAFFKQIPKNNHESVYLMSVMIAPLALIPILLASGMGAIGIIHAISTQFTNKSQSTIFENKEFMIFREKRVLEGSELILYEKHSLYLQSLGPAKFYDERTMGNLEMERKSRDSIQVSYLFQGQYTYENMEQVIYLPE